GEGPTGRAWRAAVVPHGGGWRLRVRGARAGGPDRAVPAGSAGRRGGAGRAGYAGRLAGHGDAGPERQVRRAAPEPGRLDAGVRVALSGRVTRRSYFRCRAPEIGAASSRVRRIRNMPQPLAGLAAAATSAAARRP